MGANILGTHFQVLTFGESHGPAIGAVVEGCPAGVAFSYPLLLKKMAERRPGYLPWVSGRKEEDKPELLSGVFEGQTLGTPIAFLLKNQSAQSQDYQSIKNHPRVGHADDVWKAKFGHVDYRGGGRASGRETAGRVIGGAVAQMFLTKTHPSLKVWAFPTQIGPFIRKDIPPLQNSHPINDPKIKDKTQNNAGQKWFGEQSLEVENFLVQGKKKGFSYGGAMEVRIENPPQGLGQPVFRKLKSELSAGFMSIGACYSVTLGVALEISQQEGSVLHGQKNKEVYGGIRGGISTGEPIIFHLKFKAPASVLHVAQKGRHDPCIVPRVKGVVEAMAWLIIADHVLWCRQDRL